MTLRYQLIRYDEATDVETTTDLELTIDIDSDEYDAGCLMYAGGVSLAEVREVATGLPVTLAPFEIDDAEQWATEEIRKQDDDARLDAYLDARRDY